MRKSCSVAAALLLICILAACFSTHTTFKNSTAITYTCQFPPKKGAVCDLTIGTYPDTTNTFRWTVSQVPAGMTVQPLKGTIKPGNANHLHVVLPPDTACVLLPLKGSDGTILQVPFPTLSPTCQSPSNT